MFALRDFERNEKVMAERFVMTSETFEIIPPEAAKAVNALAPVDKDSVGAKLSLNGMDCSGPMEGDYGFCGLFINMSRVNHACCGNTAHLYVDNHKVKILVASRSIRDGEEITFSYIDNPAKKIFLSQKWGFDCTCLACVDPTVSDLLQQVSVLNKQILQYCQIGLVKKSIQLAKRLIEVYDILGAPSKCYSSTYFELFSLCVYYKKTLSEAKQYIKLAYEFECAIFSGCLDTTCGSISNFKSYMDNPSSHYNYLMGDLSSRKHFK